MAIKALNLDKITNYSCRDDDPADPTVWNLGTLTSREVGQIRDAASTFIVDTKASGTDAEGDVETQINQAAMNFEACRLGLRGWSNFIDPATGEPLPFGDQPREVNGKTRRVVRPELLERIPLPVIMELGQVIMGNNEPTEADAKNSSEPSSDG